MQDLNLREKGDIPKVSAQKPVIAATLKYVAPVNKKLKHRNEITHN